MNQRNYELTDHLGNVRLSYTDNDGNGTIAQNEIVEESNYYPFGLKHKGYNNVVNSLGNASAQKWGYNGKELSEELEHKIMYRLNPALINVFDKDFFLSCYQPCKIKIL